MDKDQIAGGGGGGRRRNLAMREIGPPAFLTKTYSIVDDPKTDPIISWGKYRDTLVIWDHLKFSAEIIPKYFRHSNLSSFVYQLNNYGFRKVGGDHQWEFMHQDFQQGKIHLLENIKRRAQNPEYIPRRTCPKRPLSRILRTEINELKLEIKKLKREQQEMEFHIMALEEDMKNVEKKTKEMILSWSKAFGHEILIKITEEENNDHDHESRKKLKVDEKYVDGKKDDDEKKIVNENAICIIPSTSHDQNQQAPSTNENYETTPDNNLDNYTFWKTILLDDDDGYEGEEGGEMAAKIVLDLEHLIIKMEDRSRISG